MIKTDYMMLNSSSVNLQLSNRIKPLHPMPQRILLVIFSILGIAAAFLPWLYFPKTDDTLYGYRVDGIVTGFLFFLILVTVLFTM